MDQKEKEEFRTLFARLDDLSGRAGRGEVGITPFLSPRECHYAVPAVKLTPSGEMVLNGVRPWS